MLGGGQLEEGKNELQVMSFETGSDFHELFQHSPSDGSCQGAHPGQKLQGAASIGVVSF